jgi:hypothetical protein
VEARRRAGRRNDPAEVAGADAARSVTLDRAQRDVMQRLVVDLELGEWAAVGFVLDVPDAAAQQARRRRIETAFAILDDLGWDTEDPRDVFRLHVHDESVFTEVLLQWREWQIQAIEDVHRDRSNGRPVTETAPELLAVAARLGVVAGLLQRLDDGRLREAPPAV